MLHLLRGQCLRALKALTHALQLLLESLRGFLNFMLLNGASRQFVNTLVFVCLGRGRQNREFVELLERYIVHVLGH